MQTPCSRLYETYATKEEAIARAYAITGNTTVVQMAFNADAVHDEATYEVRCGTKLTAFGQICPKLNTKILLLCCCKLYVQAKDVRRGFRHSWIGFGTSQSSNYFTSVTAPWLHCKLTKCVTWHHRSSKAPLQRNKSRRSDLVVIIGPSRQVVSR